MIVVALHDETGRAVRYDRHDEREEALLLLFQGSDPLNPPVLSLDLPPKSLKEVAKVDIYPEPGYVGYRK